MWRWRTCTRRSAAEHDGCSVRAAYVSERSWGNTPRALDATEVCRHRKRGSERDDESASPSARGTVCSNAVRSSAASTCAARSPSDSQVRQGKVR